MPLKPHKAIALFSGGLDSILAVKVMQSLDYTVYPVFFQAPYITPEKAIHSASANGLDISVMDITARHLEMMKAPSHGFGKNYNPCIDCHALMFQVAGELLEEYGAHFLISGEVLGQRPMSQHLRALRSVGNLSGFADLIVRPLSQAYLPPTLPVREGWVDVSLLPKLQGRSRSAQFELAKQLGVVDYPPPGGGCLLTDRNYSLRMDDLVVHGQDDLYNIVLLRRGRHFRLSPVHKLIIGRDAADNAALEEEIRQGTSLRIKDKNGPLGLVTGADPDPETIRLAGSILVSYYTKATDPDWVVYQIDNMAQAEMLVAKCDPELRSRFKISLD